MVNDKKIVRILRILPVSGLAVTLLAGCDTVAQGSNNGPHAASQSSKTVTIGYVTWTEDVALSYLWQNLLEKKGYNVQLEQMVTGPLYLGVSTGDISVHLDAWLPYTDQNYIKQYGSNLTDLGTWYQGPAKIGIAVPSYVTDVNSLDQLAAHAKEFGNQVVGIDPGSGEMEVIQKSMQAYGLNSMQLVSGSETTMLSALKAAYAAHKPIAVTLWSPHWAFSQWQLKYLADPKGTMGHDERIDIEANKTWAAQNPEPAKWFRNFKLTPDQLGQLEIDINHAPTTQAGVEKWVQSNQNLVNSWFRS
ncbi:glycine betaine ABC transporter substrate-binding protein [Alicyclobacillus pomorum]|jgi:glycine betaine/proline transport system substrate-binding protein|uniref:glycine betaine ABC transporter substrate-binding protein n=1 Tax=Alicyclobacillus pomorum TaxID=204470 RepID=UPI0003FF63C1|nr:glycine betaine ABC transporter substrate-binding protein [Alicyclobacillus pomorum]